MKPAIGRTVVVVVTMLVGAVPRGDAAQSEADLWRGFAERVEVGALLDIRLKDGRRLRATFIAARPDEMLIQPKTRVSVPIQALRYQDVRQIERPRQGLGPGTATIIGIASGVGAFFATAAILIAMAGD